jgi:hypothetical protein
MLRRMTALGLVGVVVGCSMIVGAGPASAFVPSPGPITVPADTIASVLGDVLPASGAAQAAGLTLDNGDSGALNMTTDNTSNECAPQYDPTTHVVSTPGTDCTVKMYKGIASRIPGFKLGFKIGTWIDSATGLLPDQASDLSASPGYVPYPGVTTSYDGWSPAFAQPRTVCEQLSAPYGTGNACSGVTFEPDPTLVLYGQVAAGFGSQPPQGDPRLVVHVGTVTGAVLGPTQNSNFQVICVDGSSRSVDVYYGEPGPATVWPEGQNVSWGAQGNATWCDTGTGGVAKILYSTDQTSLFGSSRTSVNATWYPIGAPLAPPAPVPDEDRYWSATATCLKPDGTTVTSLPVAKGPFKDSATTIPQYPQATCPAGTVPIGQDAEITNPGGTPTGQKVVTNVPPAWADWLTANPDCWTGNCPVLLEQLMPDGVTWRSCFDNKEGCESWFADPDKATKFRCTQAGHVLSLDACNYYSPTFDPDRVGQGIVYANPADGVAVKPSTDPIDQPGSAGASLPGSSGAACYPSGWSALNPVEWVLEPVKCALTWAFVPDSATLQDFVTTVRTAYDGTAIGEWASALSNIGFTVPDGGCDGIHATVPLMVMTWDLHLFSTCDEPWSTASAVVNGFLTVSIAWFALAGTFRIIASSFGLEINGWGRRGGS